MPGRWTAVAAVNGFLAVALGAFAAHGLKKHVEPAQIVIFETGVRFQMYHAFALIAASWVIGTKPSRSASAAAWFFQAGILLFSGSLYALTFLPWKWLGPVTPLGGVCLLVGWTLLALAAGRRPQAQP